MILGPPMSTRTDTVVPDTTLCRAAGSPCARLGGNAFMTARLKDTPRKGGEIVEMPEWRAHQDSGRETSPPVCAAEYVRMSTDHQKYSTEHQAEAIRSYAEARGTRIVRTYTDAGKSGLTIEGRDALPRSAGRRVREAGVRKSR